jgi:endonuclease/exonuclease/phosphatase (EEP) superfamily protein YafD
LAVNSALIAATAGYLSLLALIASANDAGPERWWWSTINLYLPQWLWALPSLFLAILTAVFARCPTRRQRRGVAAVQLLPVLWIAGPLMGLNLPAGPSREMHARSAPTMGKPVRLRVMTYNIHGENGDPAEVMRAIREAEPDLLLAQEASGSGLEQALKVACPTWSVQVNGEHLIASRFPLEEVSRRPLPSLADDPWKSPAYLRCRLRLSPTQAVTVYNVHLSTPRPALDAILHQDSGAIHQLVSNTTTRLYQGNIIAEDAKRETYPLLIAGDFNAPPPSLICRQVLRAGLRDAFDAAGRGYGYTVGYRIKPHIAYARIDHIMVSRHYQVLDCHIGSEAGSDHRPVVADLRLTP